MDCACELMAADGAVIDSHFSTVVGVPVIRG